MSSMYVVKRDGRREEVSFDKVLRRIQASGRGLDVNPALIAQKVLARIYDGVRTSELDELAAQLASAASTVQPDYGTLAARIAVSNHQANTSASFAEVIRTLSTQTHPKTGAPIRYISEELDAVVAAHAATIDAHIDYERDFLFDYFGFKTLERAYLLKDSQGKILERPQHMWMRVALGIWGADLDNAFKTYDLMSTKMFTHATPTLFNAGTPNPQLSSCYLLAVDDDSISGIYKTLSDSAKISKHAGGIGIHIHNIRAKGSLIHGTNGTSNGIVPMLRVFNSTARYVDQCFAANTLVLTDRGEIHISEVKAGDKVLTSGCEEAVDVDGKHAFSFANGPTWNSVTHALKHNYKGPLIEVTLEGEAATPVRCTPKHPVLAIRARDMGAYRLDTAKLDYLEIGWLSAGDYIAQPVGSGAAATFSLTAIKSVVECGEFDGHLYDLEVEGTHDYTVVGMGIVHNGGGKRNGSFAIYLEPWHDDIDDFLKLKLNTGAEEERARDLFYALWVPDLFMERVEAGADWTLFCPAEAPGLADVWGDEFKALYERYEREGRGRRRIPAQQLWFSILSAQIETGTPYLVYKDAANRKSNQQNLGTIKSSNLCSEIIEYSSPEETAVCNLASVVLPSFVDPKRKVFDFARLRAVVAQIVRNLDRVIDINFYPTPETRRSNLRHRPVGIGVQGLADVFAIMRLPWEREDAAALNQRIFEHLYYAAVETSAALAAEKGSYETHAGSPASQGRLQPDLWGITPLTETDGTLDWAALRAAAAHGLRNSLLVAPMPTASTSQIMGSNEAIEPFTSNIYTRRTLAGEFIVVNKYLMRDLITYDMWDESMKQKIIAHNGSIQDITEIPTALKQLYKTAWEIKQRTLIDMAATRGAFVCQSQSLNLFVPDPNFAKLTSMHFYGWKRGLKTGIYYLRTKAPAAAQKFTVDPELLTAVEADKARKRAEQLAAEEGCLHCSS